MKHALVVAIAIFLSRRAGVAMDRIVVVLGFLMIAMTLYVAGVSGPPVGAALRNAVQPEAVDFLSIMTLVGGTVGGYITYAGAHRLVDAGVRGVAEVGRISRASVIGVIVTAVMPVLLFLAVLGVVSSGVSLDPANPAASAFEAAAGEFGMRLFGGIFWTAAITSVIGASYTSVSFVISLRPRLERRRNMLVIAFIVASTLDPFFRLPGFDCTVDYEAVRDVLTYDYVAAPRSMLKNVSKLERPW